MQCPRDRCHSPSLGCGGGDAEAFTVVGDDYSTADGTCIRDYVHVTDLADANVRALLDLLRGGVSASVNVGTGRGWSVRELVDIARKVTGRDIPIRFGARRPGVRRSSSATLRLRAHGWDGRRAMRTSQTRWRMPGLGVRASAALSSVRRRSPPNEPPPPAKTGAAAATCAYSALSIAVDISLRGPNFPQSHSNEVSGQNRDSSNAKRGGNSSRQWACALHQLPQRSGFRGWSLRNADLFTSSLPSPGVDRLWG
jgi:hypothetical protein